MQVDAMLGLMRVAETGDRMVPDLAKIVMTMMARLKEIELRAGLAEAQLADERAQVAQLQATIRRLCHVPPLPDAALA